MPPYIATVKTSALASVKRINSWYLAGAGFPGASRRRFTPSLTQSRTPPEKDSST